jgi:hypothetical protein
MSEFSLKHEQWCKCIATDTTSIGNQLTHLIWNTAVFRVVNQCRGLAERADDGGVQLNGMVHRAFDEFFVVFVATAIRRLAHDKSPISGKKSVNSLRTLLVDMRENRILLTRENLLSTDGYPMDTTILREKYDQFVAKGGKKTGAAMVDPANLDWLMAERRQTELDALCEVTPSQRNASDLISDRFFSGALAKLDESESLCVYVDQFVAHAATEESRGYRGSDEMRITYQHIWSALETICRVAAALDLHLLRRANPDYLARPHFNQFQFIETPLVTVENKDRLAAAWVEYGNETGTWSSDSLDWLGFPPR